MEMLEWEDARLLWQSAADLIRLDVEATTNLRLPLLVEVRTSRSGDVELGFNYGSGGTTLPWVPTEQTLADAVAAGELPAAATVLGLASAHLADMANENVMEALERPWPECNVHRRPMDPTPIGPTGRWQCAKDARHAAAIGGLALLINSE